MKKHVLIVFAILSIIANSFADEKNQRNQHRFDEEIPSISKRFF